MSKLVAYFRWAAPLLLFVWLVGAQSIPGELPDVRLIGEPEAIVVGAAGAGVLQVLDGATWRDQARITAPGPAH